MDTPRSDRIPEESVEPILSRAAELDRRARETVEVDVVRSAAIEAGISLDAVNQAVAEYEGRVGPAAPGPGRLAEPETDRRVARTKARFVAGVAAASAVCAGTIVASVGLDGNVRLPIIFAVVGVAVALLGRLTLGRSGRGRPPDDPGHPPSA